MDVVLEGLDTYLFDYLYAWALPVQAPVSPNATLSSIRELPTGTPYQPPQWEFKPSTSYFQFTPGPAAYQSQWPRDYLWRQAFSLFLITWFVVPHRNCFV